MGQMRRLRKLRQDRGWTLEDVAERLVEIGREAGINPGCTSQMVGRWERGETQPKAPYPKLLVELFQATASDLGIVEAEVFEGFKKAEPCGTLEDMDRRDVLDLLSKALAVPVLLHGESVADRLAHALAKPSRVDNEGVSLVEAAIANLRRREDRFGARIAIRPALAEREVICLLLQGGASGDVATRLMVAGAQLDQFLGYLAREIGDHATSRRYFGEALDLAHEAGDEALGAYVLGQMSIGLTTAREPWKQVSREDLHEGLALAQAASTRAAAKGSAATRSWLAGVEAEALASLGDSDRTERALDRARSAFSRFQPEDEPPWMYYRDAADLEFHIGLVYLALAQPESARRATELALDTFDPSMVRDRGKGLAELAETYVPDGEVDEVCRIASEALTIATETLCDPAVLRVRRLRVQLEPWASVPAVRQLDDQLASTTAWVHSGSAA